VVDGDYGPATTAVVKEFQRHSGLSSDSVDRAVQIVAADANGNPAALSVTALSEYRAHHRNLHAKETRQSQ